MIRLATFDRYCQKLLSRKDVVKLFEHKPDFLKSLHPKLEVIKGRKSKTNGGFAHIEIDLITIAEWILADPDQTRLIIRHELSHLLKEHSGLGGTEHGREFKQVLRAVSGKNYLRDLYWHTTPKINFARKKLRLQEIRTEHPWYQK